MENDKNIKNGEILKILNRNNVKIAFSKDLKSPGNLLFLFQKGWSQRAGIIPYVVKNRKYYLLLGEKINNGKITDFGGGCSKEEIPFDCAVREFQEETRNTLKFNYNNITHVIVTGKKNPHQVILLVRFPFIGNEPEIFKKSLEIPMGKSMSELNLIRWVLKDDIFTYYKNVEDSLKSMFRYLF